MSDQTPSISINRRGWLAMGIASAGTAGLATTGTHAAAPKASELQLTEPGGRSTPVHTGQLSSCTSLAGEQGAAVGGHRLLHANTIRYA